MQQLSLMTDNDTGQVEAKRLDLPDAQVDYYPQWMKPEQATVLMEKLKTSLNWRQDIITLFGKTMAIPRLQAWYGDSNCFYGYSGMRLSPLAWTKELEFIRQKLQSDSGHAFNCVLANWYRDGNDSMSLHADDEPELGPDPVIASVTFGACRPFVFKHTGTKQRVTQPLEHGSLLIMGKGTQHYYQHGIAKTKKYIGARINLTFRYLKL